MTCSTANFTYWVRIPIETNDFYPVQNVQGPKHPPIQWAPELFPGGKAVGA